MPRAPEYLVRQRSWLQWFAVSAANWPEGLTLVIRSYEKPLRMTTQTVEYSHTISKGPNGAMQPET